MRTFLCLALVIGLGLVVDQLAFQGRYTKAAWHEAKDQSSYYSEEARYWLRRAGFK